MVDARDNQIDFFVGKQMIEYKLHAIDRRAREGVYLKPLLAMTLTQKERLVDGYGLRATTLWRGRSNGYNTTKLTRHLDGGSKARSLEAVVVGHSY